MNTYTYDIAIVVVNYKVKEYIANLLSSIQRAQAGLKLQLIVIDNASNDGSEEFITHRFPEVEFIANQENLGFGKANNQGFKKVASKYTLVINPDTLVSEDTLTKLYDYMEKNPRCGASGCKILNPDGSYAPESKRAVPSIGTAITKVLGLNSLFPKHRIFGKYYLGWLDEDEINQIEVLSGSFMFWRTEVLKQLNGFDERFFMYGEDIDLCFRVSGTDYHIEYVPTTSIIHYKGESTRKGDLKYAKIFNKALYQFFEKHYSSNYSALFKWLIFFAITGKGILSFVTNNFRAIGLAASDLILLNLSIITGFLFRFNFSVEVFSNIQNLKYLWINLIASLVYVGLGSALDLFKTKKESISNQLKTIVATYTSVAAITFFVRDLAFSRLALIFGLISAIILMVIFRLFQINISKSTKNISARIRPSKILLVGKKEDTEQIKRKINSRPDWNYEVVGIVGMSPDDDDGYLGSIPQLNDLVQAYNINQVFFALKSISYKDMLEQISVLQNKEVLVKLIPDSMDFILGKSNVEYLETIPLVEVGFSYSKGMNRFLKRILDLVISLPLAIIFSSISIPSRIFKKSQSKEISGLILLNPIQRRRVANFSRLYWYVVQGKISLIGAPIDSRIESKYEYKKGLFGLVQLNNDKIITESDRGNYDLYYLQNYSIWMDIEILAKSIFQRARILEEIGEER